MKIQLPLKYSQSYNFQTLKIFIWQKFTGRLLKCMVKVQWKKGNVWKQCHFFKEDRTNMHNKEWSECMNSSGGKFSSILHTVLSPHQVINHMFLHPKNFFCKPESEEWPRDKRRCACKTGWKPWRWTFSTVACLSWLRSMTSSLIYVAAIWSSSIILVSTCCNADILKKFFKMLLTPSWFLLSGHNM